MYGTLTSLMGGLALAIGVVLFAERAARWVETDAKRRTEPAEPDRAVGR